MKEGSILRPGFRETDRHPTVEELASGVVGCGDSWCDGEKCGMPALTYKGRRVFGAMVAVGPVLQRFRYEWKGSTHEISLPEGFETEKWMWW